MRRKETRPTSIYWLVDNRDGIPFYCGKTVLALSHRLDCHKREARTGTRRVHVKVRNCGESVSIHQVESVPVEGDWSAREKRWIFLLRHMNPDCCNTADGGAGATGHIVSAETRAKLSAMFKGRSTHTPEMRAHLSAIGMGRKRSRESVEKGRAKMLGKKLTPEQCAAISARNKALYEGPQGDEKRRVMGLRRKGVVVSAETREKQRIAKLGTKRTPEEKARISAANLGKKMSPEAIAKSAAARTGKKRTPEQRARMSAAHKGKPWSQAQRESRTA